MDFKKLFKKAEDLVDDNADKVKDGIDKAADFVDSKVDDKHDGKIESAKEKLSGLVDKLDKDKK